MLSKPGLPAQPWDLRNQGTSTHVVDAQGAVIARFFCDAATGHKTYNEQWAQAENVAQLLLLAPALVQALQLCTQSLDQLLPYLGKVPADIGLLNEALIAARPLLAQLID